MKYLIGNYYVEVRDHGYKILIQLKIIFYENEIHQILWELSIKFKTKLKLEKKSKIVENNGKLEVKSYPKSKQPIQQQQKFNPPNCPSWKQNMWLGFDKGYYCKNCEYIINKQKHQIDKKFSVKIKIFELDCHMLIKR